MCIRDRCDEARGLDGLRSVLALVEVHDANARQQGEGDRLPEVEQRAAREPPLDLEGLGVLNGEADPE
eukprot:788640-Alexandrium_andersonii.AAC.1